MKVKIVSMMLMILLVACVPPTAKKEEAKIPLEKETKKVAPLYAQELKPMAPAECGRCHSPIYNLIRKQGGKHQINCVRCHKKFHRYNPIKKNWAKIMPKCQNCHGLYHGEKLAQCMKCHVEPHAPKNIPMSSILEKNCLTCHGEVGKEMKKYPSLHSEQACSMCHEKHGYIPSCMDCHEPHIASLTTNKQCLICHPVHSPLRPLKFPEDTSNAICAACHAEVAETLDANQSKHHSVACIKCHSVHKYIPKCTQCHPKTHSKTLIKQFPDCLKCHIDPHNLPVKKVAR